MSCPETSTRRLLCPARLSVRNSLPTVLICIQLSHGPLVSQLLGDIRNKLQEQFLHRHPKHQPTVTKGPAL